MATTGIWKPLLSEPSPGDSIVEAPSLVVPLLLKTEEANEQMNQDDEVEIIGQQGGNFRNPQEYVKASCVAALTQKGDQGVILTLKDYHNSFAGKLLLDIGLNRANERNLESNARKIAYRLRNKSSGNQDLIRELELIKKELVSYQELNKPFKSRSKFMCPHCHFATEFMMVLDGHLEIPHISHRKEYMCNWCEFKTKSADQIIAHFMHNHKKRCKVEKPLPIYLCRFCSYETNSKRLITSHTVSCLKTFPQSSFMGPQFYGENDYPGVTPKPITQDDIKAYERARNAMLLSSYNPHQLSVSNSNEQRRVLIVPSRYLPHKFNRASAGPTNVTSESNIASNPLQHFVNSRDHDRNKKVKSKFRSVLNTLNLANNNLQLE